MCFIYIYTPSFKAVVVKEKRIDDKLASAHVRYVVKLYKERSQSSLISWYWFKLDFFMIANTMSQISPVATRRLIRELGDLKKNPPEGIRLQANEQDMLDLTAIIEGPGMLTETPTSIIRGLIVEFDTIEGTPYAGGYFRVKFKFTEEFPAAPPKCTLLHIVLFCPSDICLQVGLRPKFSTQMFQAPAKSVSTR